MRKLIITSQNDMAKKLLELAESIIEIQDEAFACNNDELEEKLKNLKEEEVLILCDEFSGSSFNETALAIKNAGFSGKSLLVSGVNLSMVLSGLEFLNEEDTLEELGKTLVAQAKASIKAMPV